MDANQIDYALNTFYLLICGALVMWMAAGFAMLEAGLVRSKNTVEILLKNVSAYAIACVMYFFVGYQIMYGGGTESGIIPSFGFGIGAENAPDGGADYSKMADFFFQVVFVATATSIISGAVAERMKLWAFFLFCLVMTSIIYPVQGYWHWGGGFLNQMGFSDFAGSGIVHLAGAAAALSAVLLLGPRSGKYGKDGRISAMPGANLPLATLGIFILWLGWFGFNGGSQLKISTFDDANIVALVFVNTNLAAAGGLIAALLTSRTLFGKGDLTMVLNGALAGLVAITAAPHTPTPSVALLVGSVAGVLVIFAILELEKNKIDDPVGAISAHGIAGIWGLLAVPLSTPGASFKVQLIGIVVIFAWVFITSSAVWMVLKMVMGLRVSQEEEFEGLDISECGLEAYPEFTSN
ncbi:ammonium transporter [Candidatus Albibeggiatoa sp. nov. NOAA]|uniref:ammonium transporter n=1 Tax=Candidatus Albibeggiatoa sp. nov. NOAA TaxID=3162724 RepID=UPI0032F883F5|nr:ammonium transporter [Thiotrichaceae bacterium]